MQRYRDRDNDSGVQSYEIGPTFIKLKFKSRSKVYEYTYAKEGQRHVEKMKSLALAGDGLNSYINKHIRKYSRK